MVPWPGSLGTQTVRPASFSDCAQGVIEIGEWSDRNHRLPLLHKLVVTKDAHGRYVITFTDMGVELLLKKL